MSQGLPCFWGIDFSSSSPNLMACSHVKAVDRWLQVQVLDMKLEINPQIRRKAKLHHLRHIWKGPMFFTLAHQTCKRETMLIELWTQALSSITGRSSKWRAFQATLLRLPIYPKDIPSIEKPVMSVTGESWWMFPHHPLSFHPICSL